MDGIEQSESSNNLKYEIPMFVAIVTHMKDNDEIRKIFKREVEKQGCEKDALCYFKV